MGQLIVIRHGQASLLAADYDQLSELGRTQARRLGEYWREHDVVFDRVYCGPAKRHRDTAALARQAYETRHRWPQQRALDEIDEHDAFGMVKKAVPALRGDLDIERASAALAVATNRREKSAGFQRLFELVMGRWLCEGFELPGIESWPSFRDRVERGTHKMLEEAGKGETVLAFSSVGPLAVMLRMALNTTDLRSFQTAWRIRNSSITRFVFGRGQLTLDGYNSLPHLTDPTTHTFR